MNASSMNVKRTSVIIFITSFLLNLLWEISHSLLYNWNAPPLENNASFFVGRILQSTIGDAIIIVIIFFIVAAFNKSTDMITPLKWKDYSLVVFLGLSFAILIEMKAKILQNWSYNEYMPTFLGIGITPLFQLAVTAILTLMIAKEFLKKE